MIYVKPTGPRNAAIMLVGEAPGENEEREGRPFCGAAGYELTTELRDAGLAFTECFVTNVIRYKPDHNDISNFITPIKSAGEARGYQFHEGMWVAPFVREHLTHLMDEIDEVQPNVIVALGNTPLWALAHKTGITKWRGSQMLAKCGRKLVPVLHPAFIMREYSSRACTIMDYKNRVKHESYTPTLQLPSYNFTIRPSFQQVHDHLNRLEDEIKNAGLYKLTFDLETRRGQIACAGLGFSKTEALCIPFMCLERGDGYWSLDEEQWIVQKLRSILSHKNLWLIGQNLLYDCQYTYNQWKFAPYVSQDTMIWHHTLFPGIPKGLDFLASLYAEYYCYWKDEGKEWSARMNEEELWHYNCLDCTYTYEVADRLIETTNKFKFSKQVAFQQSIFYPALDMMTVGVRIDKTKRAAFNAQLDKATQKLESKIEYVLGHKFNPRSPVQMQRLFYDDLKQDKIFSRKTGSATLDAKALSKIADREPLLRPLVEDIENLRSLGVFKSTFVEAELDPDDRVRCSFNIAGPETFRWSSSTNAFGRGMNLQNIPKVNTDKESKRLDEYQHPDVRQMFVPDPEHYIMDWDLDRADLQVVVWEADDTELKQMLREGIDLHSENAKVLLCARDLAKRWVHGTNYGGSARTMAINCGITVYQSDIMRKRWFAAHPGIPDWHRRVEKSLASTHSVSNAFGYRRLYFDRIDGLLPEALAWIPQSTVALVINHGLVRLYNELPQVQLLLQVHDSLVMQTHKRNVPAIFPMIRERLLVTVPYPDPLIIPISGKGSYSSWGECEKLAS